MKHAYPDDVIAEEEAEQHSTDSQNASRNRQESVQLADNLAAFKSLQRNVAEEDGCDDEIEALAIGAHLAGNPGAGQGAG